MENYRLPLEFAEALVKITASNKGKRGISKLCKAEHWQKAAEGLAEISKIALVSGFFVPASGAPETDGPGGTSILARAFFERGAAVEIWTDSFCADAMRSCARAVGFPADRVLVMDCFDEFDRFSPEAVVFIERLGRAADGKYYNMRKKDISFWTPSLDWISILSSRKGIFTVGIGDGGNEVGMGNFISQLREIRPDFKKCLSVIPTDVAIPVDVSNWGAYALSAALSCIWGEWHGPRDDDEKAMLDALIKSNAVDGISNRNEPTVDGFDLGDHLSLSSKLHLLWSKSQS